MFEFQDNFLMGPKTAIENGELRTTHCNATNAADEQLDELARVVGGGESRPVADAPLEDKGMVLIDEAPALEFDLEGELAKAFDDNSANAIDASAPNPEPQPVRDVVAIETAFATQPDIAETAPVESAEDVDFSEMIGAELERALEEEVAADAALGAATKVPVAPPIPQETMTPWDAPEIVEAPHIPTTDETLSEGISETVQQSFEAPQMADFETSNRDYSDPAAVFDDLQVESSPSADTGSMHIDAVIGGTAALGLAAASTRVETPHQLEEAPAFDPAMAAGLESEISHDISSQFNDGSVSIPEPDIIVATGGSRNAGRRVALAVVAVALLGGGATLAWNNSGTNGGIAPTILASTEPVKVKPKDAGGKVVPNQDLAVYKTANDAKTKKPAQKRLTDKTEKSIVVASKTAKQEDKNLTTGGSIVVKPRLVRTVVVKPDGTILNAAKKQPVIQSATSEITAPVLALKPELVSVGAVKPVVNKTPNKAPQAKVYKKPVEVAKLKLQPAKLKPVAVKPVEVKPPKTVVAKKVAKATVPSVTSPYAVQIASQRSADAAQKSYQNLSRRYASVLNGKGVDIRKGVIKGKGTYYRVRIPAQSRADARKICAQLKARGGACFVTR